ncbi:MAG: MarR family transcriptional regulator [Nocardioidaceae bacterium]
MDGEILPIAALVRRPATTVRRRVVEAWRAEGLEGLLPGHLSVFTMESPEGVRPGQLAARVDFSKQAMNHLLGQLETLGYLTREPDPTDGRTKVVRLTDRGRRAQQIIHRVARDLDAELRAHLGVLGLESLRHGLMELDGFLRDHPSSGMPVNIDSGGATDW